MMARFKLAAERNRIVTVLDIGAQQLRCLIAERGSGGRHPRVLGLAESDSAGLRAGMPVDAARAEDAIRTVVAKAERIADVVAHEVHVVAPMPVASETFAARVKLPAGRVAARDITRVMAAARDYAAREGRQPLHVMPVGYDLGYATGLDNPLGMTGEVLEVEVHALTAAPDAVSNLRLVLERAHLALGRVISAPYAAACACVPPGGDDAPLIAIDLGESSTGIAYLAHGACHFAAVLPGGGENATREIAVTFGLPRDEAERVKTTFGAVFGDLADAAGLALPVTGGTSATRPELSRLLARRQTQTLLALRETLAQSGLTAAGARVQLAGGGAALPGMMALAAQIFDCPAAAALPAAPQGCREGELDGRHVALLGGLRATLNDAQPAAPRRTMARMGQWLAESF